MMSTIQHVFSGAGAPANAPGSLSAHYTDTTTGDQYYAKGTDSAADWVLQEKGGAAAAAVQAHNEAADPHPQYAAAAAPAAAATAAIDALKLEADPLPQYVQKVEGKQLSSEDFTAEEKAKLAGLGGESGGGLTASLTAIEPVVRLVAKTRTHRSEGDTFSAIIPSEVKAGDLLVACVGTTYGSGTVDPAGWTKAVTISCSYRERTSSIYTRVAQAGDAGSLVTWSNESWPEFTVQLLAFRGLTAASIANFNSVAADGNGTDQLAVAPVTATKDGQIALAVVNHYYTDYESDGLFSDVTVPAGWLRITNVDYVAETDGEAQGTTHIALKILANAEVAAGNFASVSAAGSTDNDVASVTVLITA